MSSFDTHGGYFAPKDYMKVEAGGTHEENPNGGVQIGVDQEGTPNLLEEGEPVYKDYVYSDNIKASERFLKDNNIPEKYAGELYSKIADSFFSEAENRPYDPISRNGLEAMLGRLADAQEGQKAYNEQRQLERELKNLSPDELAALEEMLAAQEQPGLEGASADVPPMPVQPEMVPQEQMAPEQMPVMRNGGKVNRFDWKSKLNRPLAGLMNSLRFPRDTQIAPTNVGYVFYPPVVGQSVKQIHPGPLANAWSNGYMWNGYTAPVEQAKAAAPEQEAANAAATTTPAGKTAASARANAPALQPLPQELQDIVDNTIANSNVYDLSIHDLPQGPGFGDYRLESPAGGLAGRRPIGDIPDVQVANPYLSTFPRYAGAVGAGLLGLYNAFQRPDRYTATRYKPFTPTGRISLQDQVYNPVDQNMLMNQVLAQGNSTQRALRNSGLGPSTAAAIIAQDNNITGNLGNTFLQAWDANNQRRNQVIAANNQNEAQRAQFDYAVDAARQRALAEAQMRNAYTDLQLQQLNYGAEGDKYAAISNQISNALQALSGIGQENFAMNQVNSNPENEGYGAFSNGVVMYDPYRYKRAVFKCGGKKK